MRLSTIGSIIRATVMLAPAAIALACASYVWVPSKYPELPAWRVRGFRWGLKFAWLATAFFLIASVDQLRTRQILPGFWGFVNLCATFLAMLGIVGAFAGRGWGRVSMLGWGLFLIIGILAVVVTTIP